MSNSLLAKFVLEQSCTLDNFIKEKYFTMFSDLMENTFDSFEDNYRDKVAEYVEETYGDLEFNEEEGVYIHPDTNEEIEFESWQDAWYSCREEVFISLLESFREIVLQEIRQEYRELKDNIEIIISDYLEEILDYEWPR